MMDEYINKGLALEAKMPHYSANGVEIIVSEAIPVEYIEKLPAADVLPRDEAIKMGAELAAMYSSDATSQQLEEAYLEGVEYGMTRRDVRPIVRGRWVEFKTDTPPRRNECSECGYITNPWLAHVYNFCPNCGADMRELQ